MHATDPRVGEVEGPRKGRGKRRPSERAGRGTPAACYAVTDPNIFLSPPKIYAVFLPSYFCLHSSIKSRCRVQQNLLRPSPGTKRCHYAITIPPGYVDKISRFN